MNNKRKNQKGITTADIIVSVILISIFVTIITVAAGGLQNTNTEVEREMDAMHYAIQTIEIAKSQKFSVFPTIGKEQIEGVDELKDGYIIDENGETTSYYRTVRVKDFSEMPGKLGSEPEIVKKITVTVTYLQNNEEKNVTLSTVVSKE